MTDKCGSPTRFGPKEQILAALQNPEQEPRESLERAIKEIERRIALNPSDFDSYMDLACCNRDIGNYRAAESNLNAALSLSTSENREFVYWHFTELYRQSGDIEKAIESQQKYFDLKGSDIKSYELREHAEMLKSFGRTKEAAHISMLIADNKK